MRHKLVVGNWKMNGSLARNAELLDSLAAGLAAVTGAQFAVCVPFPYLQQAQNALRNTGIAWGAQNCSQFAKGAYTGEVSAAMLVDFGCRYVIVGHSERRTLYAEDSGMVAAKFRAAQDAGLIPILCVGETLAQREAGITEQIVAEQLQAVVEVCGTEGLAASVVAYEPIWAIGTGRTATPDQAQAVHAHIRELVRTRSADVAASLKLLYGGSVNAANAGDLFAMPDIDGGLIGGASLVAEDFTSICRAASC